MADIEHLYKSLNACDKAFIDDLIVTLSSGVSLEDLKIPTVREAHCNSVSNQIQLENKVISKEEQEDIDLFNSDDDQDVSKQDITDTVYALMETKLKSQVSYARVRMVYGNIGLTNEQFKALPTNKVEIGRKINALAQVLKELESDKLAMFVGCENVQPKLASCDYYKLAANRIFQDQGIDCPINM